MTLIENNGMRILKADENCVIYRKDDENNYSECFYLGKKDNIDNFEEINKGDITNIEDAEIIEETNN